jgi:hypothetical protein
MILIKLGEITNGSAPVIVECFEPETIPEHDLGNWIQIEEKPDPTVEIGKIPNLFYNTETGQLFYEYTERPLTPEEELKQVKEKQALMQQAIDELIFGGAV